MSDETHKHKCDDCGFIWEHGEECRGDTKAHTCAKCGGVTTARYYRNMSREELQAQADADHDNREFPKVSATS